MYPVVDLNGCLLAYLAGVPGAHPGRGDEIGCAVPRLLEGNVKIQVLALYADLKHGSAEAAWRQVEVFRVLLRGESRVRPVGDPEKSLRADGVGVLVGIEGANCLCDDDAPLDAGFRVFERIDTATGGVLYLTLTRQGESRFGGGSDTQVGLKADGRVLLEYLSGRGVALDLAHAGDRLAGDIFEHIDRRGLTLPVLASHANFRSVWNHHANLSDAVAQEIVRRRGLIGLNFIRAFVHAEDPDALRRHVEHGFFLGGEEALCLGADFFCSRAHPDRSRVPFYFHGHEHAGRYQEILRILERRIGREACAAIAFANAVRFMKRLGYGARPAAGLVTSATAQAP